MEKETCEVDLTEIKTNDNTDKLSTSTSCSAAFLLELESKTNANKNISENVLKANLTIEHLEKMITASAAQLGQLTTEYLKAKKEVTHQQKEANLQKDYQTKEIEALQRELELTKSLLNGRCKKMERTNNRNAALQNEITSNRYKIFCMNFNSSAEEEEETDHQSSQKSSSETTNELSETMVTSDDDVDDGGESGETNSKSTTSEELEGANDIYSS